MSAPGHLTDEIDNRIPGVATGIVVDNEDPEGLARVKVTYPWRDAEDESYWARIATLSAGDDRGMYFLPDIGDEVLVAFEGGDIHYPFIIGSLWNGNATPPQRNDGKNNIRQIKTRSGHEILFDDSDGDGTIKIETTNGRTIILNDAGGGDISISDGTNSIDLAANSGELSISAASKISLSAPDLELKGGLTVKIESGTMLELKGLPIHLN
jgi:uncharacterized protein involved in type VI secretion and phage assembly